MRVFIHSLLILFFSFCNISAHAAEILMVTWQGRFLSEKAFEKRIKELRPDIKIRHLDAKRSKKELSSLLRNYDLSSTDLIYSFGTTGTQLVKKFIGGKKPIVFNMVSTPVLSNLVDSLEKPGHNITGARLLVDFDTQLKIYRQLNKNIKRVALWFDPREKQNTAVYKAISIYGKAKGIEVVPFRIIPDSLNAKRRIREAAASTNKMDAMYIVTGSSFWVHAKWLMSLLDPKLLVLGSINTDVIAGATVALGANLSERGKVSAEIAHRILNGEKAGDIPISVVNEKNAVLFVNKRKKVLAGLTGLDKLGVKIVELEETYSVD